MSPLYLYNGALLLSSGKLAESQSCCCCQGGPCTITPSVVSSTGITKTHTLDACQRTITLNYESGPGVTPRNNPETSVPNTYDIYCNGVNIASTNGWVGGSRYANDPAYQPLVGGPVGSISGVKPQGPTTIQVVVGGSSASYYTISCA